MSQLFKQCSGCTTCWTSRDAFLADPDIVLIGYQIHFRRLNGGLFMFNHSCGTTLALPVSTFEDMYKGEIASQRATGTPACPGHCLYQKELGSCPATCECNYVREIIQLIRQPAAPTTETQAEH